MAAVAALLSGVGLWLLLKSGQRLVGEIEVYRNGRFVQKVLLPSMGKRRLTIGAQGDILLATTDVPAVVAQLYAEQGADGQTEMYLDLHDGSDGTVSVSLLLYHGIEIKLPDSYSVKYTNPISEEWFNEGESYEDP